MLLSTFLIPTCFSLPYFAYASHRWALSQSDSVKQFQDIVHSTNITTKAYALAENLVKTGYSLAEPVLGYGAPVIQRADGLANKGCDDYGSSSVLVWSGVHQTDVPFSFLVSM